MLRVASMAKANACEVQQHPLPRRVVLWVRLEVGKLVVQAPAGSVAPSHLPLETLAEYLREHDD